MSGAGSGPRSGRSLAAWYPPVPTEHGAWVMLTAALATPLAVGVVRFSPGADQLGSFAVLVGIAVAALWLRTAVDRYSLRRPVAGLYHPIAGIVILESAVVLVLSLALGWLAGWLWVATAAVIPAVVLERWIGGRGWPVPIGGELAGVTALSMAVPTGTVLLGGATGQVVSLWALFFAFHLLSVLRVRVSLSSAVGKQPSYRTLRIGHGVLVAGLVLGWMQGIVGIAAPIVFAVALVRAVRLSPGGGDTLKDLGRTEGTLSVGFVLLSPWLV